MLREIVHIGDAHAAGVDQLEEALIVAHQVGDAVARDARLVVDNGDPHAGEPIEQAAFAYVGSADNDYLRNAHRSRLCVRAVSDAAGALFAKVPIGLGEAAKRPRNRFWRAELPTKFLETIILGRDVG